MSNYTGTCLFSHLPSILLHTKRCVSGITLCIVPDLRSCTLWRIQMGCQGYKPHLSPISFIFMQFSATTMQNNRLTHQTLGLARPSGKSWIHYSFEIGLNEIVSRVNLYFCW